MLPDTFTRENAQKINKDNFGKSSRQINRVLKSWSLNKVLKESQDKHSFIKLSFVLK